jgi:hypothetical protein
MTTPYDPGGATPGAENDPKVTADPPRAKTEAPGANAASVWAAERTVDVGLYAMSIASP